MIPPKGQYEKLSQNSRDKIEIMVCISMHKAPGEIPFVLKFLDFHFDFSQ